MMRSLFHMPGVLLCLLAMPTSAQDDGLLALEDAYVMGDAGADPAAELEAYERLVQAIGGDSVRACAGMPCSGWVEDHYANGTLKHRGYYVDGRLVTYRNHHPNGALEREFKLQGSVKALLRTYHANGALRSETNYVKGRAQRYEDHYVNGVLRYAEERHPKRPYYTRMELYDGEGRPISILRTVDAGNEEFLQQEYHPGGALRSEGRARFHPKRQDVQRVGTWQHYAPDGTLLREDRYIDGIVHR